ncbi:F0F1 ATP synthase subunit delta [Jonesia quinghaiensis]|uniref:F0F1 ATP synthase subunit delta n=1 Tax=Jonesia quinghaiensis TaxID=262806 RepID=UPI00048CC82E|nr:F0F1 ATP synthase subunit delta [Jonesia quinghaiensis]
MRGTSQASLTATRKQAEVLLAAAGRDATSIGEQLFSIVDALDSSGALRRSLADPSRPAQDKATLVGDLLGARFDKKTVEIVKILVSQRWSAERDVVDAVSTLGIDAYLSAAESRGVLETVESELFAITRSLSGQREFRKVLSDTTIPTERRSQLLVSLIASRVDEVTLALANRVAIAPRGRLFVPLLAGISDMAAERRHRRVAHVTVSAPLKPEHVARLSGVLASSYGQAMQMNITVDPHVVGGVRIQVGSDVIDSTLLARLTQAQRKLAS